MGKYEEITKARQILELYESASLRDVKYKYRELLKEWHPEAFSGRFYIYHSSNITEFLIVIIIDE